MVVLRDQQPLCVRQALYLGTAAPIQTAKGIDAVQRPLTERYKGDLSQVEGIPCELSVWPDCLEMQYNSTGEIIQFPLRNLTICAAVRCIDTVNGSTGEITKQFVPINIVMSDSKHPAIFTAIIRRSQGRQILECHSFICKSNRDALLLVSATGTANMALKRNVGKVTETASQYEDGIPVVHMAQQNGYSSADDSRNVTSETHLNRYGTEYQEPSNQTLLVKSSIETGEQQQYTTTTTARGITTEKGDDNTIYITFDKSNLVSTGESTLKVDNTNVSQDYAGEGRVIHASDRSVVIEKPVYVDVPAPQVAPPPRPVVIEAPRYYLRPAPLPPPPPQQVVYRRPVPIPPPRPVVVPAQLPPPPQIVYRAPPPPPPAPPVVVRTTMAPAPPPQRIYTRRVVPAHQRRFLSPQPPVVVRARYPRSRSASPGYARSEFHVRSEPVRVSRVTGHHSDPGIGGGEFSNFIPPSTTYGQYGHPMFLNERAFSKRMNADQRISGFRAPYNHPSAYDFQNAMELEQMTYKSNPKYSSSSSGSDRDQRFSKRMSSKRRSRRT